MCQQCKQLSKKDLRLVTRTIRGHRAEETLTDMLLLCVKKQASSLCRCQAPAVLVKGPSVAGVSRHPPHSLMAQIGG